MHRGHRGLRYAVDSAVSPLVQAYETAQFTLWCLRPPLLSAEVKVLVKDKGSELEEVDFAKISLDEAFKILEVLLAHTACCFACW